MSWKEMVDKVADWLLILSGLFWGTFIFLNFNAVSEILKLPLLNMLKQGLIYGLVVASSGWKLARILKIIK
jgi:hypothetical protein